MKTHVTALLMMALVPSAVLAQEAPPPITMSQAVQQAIDKYPAVRASLEQVSSAAAGIDLARTAYLPRVDLLMQINRATRNNVFGMILPQSIIPGISGPVLGTNDMANVWGSAAGVLVSWEPFDFGLRRANIQIAESAKKRTDTGVEWTRFQVGTAAADAFLTILAAQRTVIAARAAVERARVFGQAVDTLARNGLRPGADAARSRAEIAVAETQLIQSEEAVEMARASLSQFLNVPPAQISIEPGVLLEVAPEFVERSAGLAGHPEIQQQKAAIDEVKAAERALSRSYFPRFTLQATTYGRGTGARTDGTTGGGFSGFGPDIQNWGIGMSIVFPLLDLPDIRARREIELHRERSETAQYERILQDLQAQIDRARAQLEGARRIARNTPIQLEAARTAEQQATARYRTGLGNVVEVAEAERLLTQAEIDDSLAKLGVWRGLLAVAAASGDLQPFLQRTEK